MLQIIGPESPSPVLEKMMQSAVDACHQAKVLRFSDTFQIDSNDRLLFAFDTDEFGLPCDVYNWLRRLVETREAGSLQGCTGSVMVASSSEYYTKTACGSVIFNLNRLGVEFIGHPLIEALPDYQNFRTWQKTLNLPLENICLSLTAKLAQRLAGYQPFVKAEETAHLLVLHASSHKTSNTLSLWNMAAAYLDKSKIDIQEIHVDNGSVQDCIGCSYKKCLHYGQQKRCYYGGIMTNEIFPAIEKADAIVWICPNYNDALAANLTAVINRLTALYRHRSFYDKCVYGVIVSGNSGNDAVARQLLGALNINKGFRLPPGFAITATANDPGSLKKITGIEDKARMFAERIEEYLLQ